MNSSLTTTTKKELTPQQIEVLSLIVSGQSYEQAAHAAGISPSVIHKWMKQPVFHEEYKLSMERFRNIFESRTVAVAQKGIKVIHEFLEDKNPEIRLEAAKVAVNSAVRLSNRYKELQVQGFIAPAQPLVIFPANTQLPWTAKESLPLLPDIPEDIIDAESVPVPDGAPGEDDD